MFAKSKKIFKLLQISNYMACINIEDFGRIREEYKDKKIVFCSGAFDLTHVGHVLFLEECKKLGDILVVAVGDDALASMNKGPSRPILNEKIRLKMVDSLKPVDFSVIDNVSFKEKNTHHILDVAFKELKPDVYAVNDETFDIELRKNLCEKHNIKFAIMKRTTPPGIEPLSTTKIIKKIKELTD